MNCEKILKSGCIFLVIIVNCTITDNKDINCYTKGGVKMKKTNHTLTVSCPQCGTEVKSQAYTYMMECDRCLSKKDE